MKLTSKAPGRLTKTAFLVVFATEEKPPKLPSEVAAPDAFLSDFKADAKKSNLTYASSGPARMVLAAGLGKQKKVDAEALRRAAAVAVRRAEARGAAQATMLVDDHVARLAGGPERVGCALAEGALMGAYHFTDLKSDAKPPKLRSVTLVGAGTDFKKGVRRGRILAEANLFARDLQNEPGNRMTPTAMAAAARAVARRSEQITCRVLDEEAMERLGMGLLLSVAQGTSEPAKLVHLVYKPRRKARAKIAFVGKGLTFDAGGISLKPAAKMDEMRFDMSGGAAVIGAFHGLAELDVPYEVHGIVPCTENLINGEATKPGDVHRAMNGTTVEILNTDAEGRLILADALAYATTKVKADTIIDLATLTGAVVVGLGHEVSGMFASTPRLRRALDAAGEATGERVWPLPLYETHKSMMKGTSADLRNIGPPDMGGGAIAGAAFLAHFVENGAEWCHLDIAGTAWGGAQRDWVGGPRGSGVGARLLLEYLEARDRVGGSAE